MWNSLFILLALSVSSDLWAAACCVSQGGISSLITGDEAIKASIGAAYSQTIADAQIDRTVTYRRNDDHEYRLNYSADLGVILFDRLQLGATLPWTRRTRTVGETSRTHTGIGDIRASLAYEILPEWEYSSWRPKAFIFAQLTIPTGNSIHTTQGLYTIDVTGRGFFIPSVGGILLKSWGDFDASFSIEAHQPISRSFGDSQYAPGIGASSALSFGFTPLNGDIRLGSSISLSYDQATQVSGLEGGEGEPQQLNALSFQIGWAVQDDLSVLLNYQDDLLMGGSHNFPLNRMASLRIQTQLPR